VNLQIKQSNINARVKQVIFKEISDGRAGYFICLLKCQGHFALIKKAGYFFIYKFLN